MRDRGDWRLRAFALTCVLVAMALSGCTTTVRTAPAPTPSTVTASGSGTVSAIPDEADVSFGVTAQAATAKAALDQVSAKATKVTDALKKAGIADKDIQTENVSVNPVYSQSASPAGVPPRIVGYQASLSVSAKARDLATLGSLITAATQAGADTVNGPRFTISADSTYRDQATQKAFDDARRSAGAMAKAAGKSLGAVVSMNSQAAQNPVPLAFNGVAAAPSASVPIQPGQLDVTNQVTVVFQLK